MRVIGLINKKASQQMPGGFLTQTLYYLKSQRELIQNKALQLVVRRAGRLTEKACRKNFHFVYPDDTGAALKQIIKSVLVLFFFK